MFSGMYYSPRGPNFRPFRSTGHRLQVTANFSCDGGGGGGGDNSETNVLNGESGYVQWYATVVCSVVCHRFRVTANFKIIIISQWKI